MLYAENFMLGRILRSAILGNSVFWLLESCGAILLVAKGICRGLMLSGSLMWRLTLLLLVTMMLLTACGGGGDNGGGSNGGGGGGNDNGDGNGGDGSREPTTVVSLINTSLEIIPSGDSFNITLSNYQSFATDDIRGINITAIAGDSKTSQFISLSNLTGNAVTFVLANLTSGRRYNFSVSVIDTDGSLRSTRIVFVEQQNAEDHEAGGIYLGPNFDGDYQADEVDEDDDNDNLLDTEEVDADNNSLVVNGIMCSLLADCDKDGLADNHTREQLENSDGMKCLLSPDCDRDNVTDTDEAENRCVILADCDDDNVNDGEDNCPTDSRDWKTNPADDTDSDGCHNEDDSDDDNDNLLDTEEVDGSGNPLVNASGFRCSLVADCDKDGLADNHPTEQLENSKGESCSVLMDCDNDSLADNHPTEQLMNREGISCSVLPNCDNDTIADNNGDSCPAGIMNWRDTSTNDPDNDGCHNDEDENDDTDTLLDTEEVDGSGNPLVNASGFLCSLVADCDNDGLDDDDAKEQQVNTAGESCSVLVDCDGDRVPDVDEASAACTSSADCDGDGHNDNDDACPNGMSNGMDDDNDGCYNAEDVDDDGDGLIEIRTADELDAVRNRLDGTGFKISFGADLDDSGCGGQSDIDACNGYELENNISLAAYSSGQGWTPLAVDTISGQSPGELPNCQGTKFTGIFEGNGFVISNLTIDSPSLDCIGLFGQVAGTIRNLGVLADSIKGRYYVGALAGQSAGARIIKSYAASNEVGGEGYRVGGLVGWAYNTKIIQSYAVTGTIHGKTHRGTGARIGGLAGEITNSEIIQSFAVNKVISGRREDETHDQVGGLVGEGGNTKIIQSFAVSGEILGTAGIAFTHGNDVAGLVGDGEGASIIQSYAVSESITGGSYVGGLMGRTPLVTMVQSYAVSGSLTAEFGVAWATGLASQADDDDKERTAQASYYDSDTSGIMMRNIDMADSTNTRKNTMELQSNTFTDLYATWDDGSVIDGLGTAALNTTGTRWCDEDLSGTIEADEDEDNNRVWDLGTTSQYPALRCIDKALGIDQRAWWSLSSRGKPQLNEALLNATIEGSYP